VVRKPTSSANLRRKAITVAAGGNTIARHAETASTEPRGAAGNFAASWPDLPTLNLDARKPGTTNNSYAVEHEPKGAEEEMPMIWPVLTEAESAGVPDSASDSSTITRAPARNAGLRTDFVWERFSKLARRSAPRATICSASCKASRFADLARCVHSYRNAWRA
jgi:hypothetical protein